MIKSVISLHLALDKIITAVFATDRQTILPIKMLGGLAHPRETLVENIMAAFIALVTSNPALTARYFLKELTSEGESSK